MNKIVDKINGYGPILRLVTPFMIALVILLLGMVNSNIRDVKAENNLLSDKVDTYFTNHLSHHMEFEKAIEGRLATIEAYNNKRR